MSDLIHRAACPRRTQPNGSCSSIASAIGAFLLTTLMATSRCHGCVEGLTRFLRRFGSAKGAYRSLGGQGGPESPGDACLTAAAVGAWAAATRWLQTMCCKNVEVWTVAHPGTRGVMVKRA